MPIANHHLFILHPRPVPWLLIILGTDTWPAFGYLEDATIYLQTDRSGCSCGMFTVTLWCLFRGVIISRSIHQECPASIHRRRCMMWRRHICDSLHLRCNNQCFHFCLVLKTSNKQKYTTVYFGVLIHQPAWPSSQLRSTPRMCSPLL